MYCFEREDSTERTWVWRERSSFWRAEKLVSAAEILREIVWRKSMHLRREVASVVRAAAVDKCKRSSISRGAKQSQDGVEARRRDVRVTTEVIVSRARR